MTKEKFEMVFMIGPIEEPMLSARMPVFVRLSAVCTNLAATCASRA